MDYDYYKLKCKCGRKILVEIVLFGVNHNFEVIATCAECLKIQDKFKKERPKEAKDIIEWLKL